MAERPAEVAALIRNQTLEECLPSLSQVRWPTVWRACATANTTQVTSCLQVVSELGAAVEVRQSSVAPGKGVFALQVCPSGLDHLVSLWLLTPPWSAVRGTQLMLDAWHVCDSASAVLQTAT